MHSMHPAPGGDSRGKVVEQPAELEAEIPRRATLGSTGNPELPLGGVTEWFNMTVPSNWLIDWFSHIIRHISSQRPEDAHCIGWAPHTFFKLGTSLYRRVYSRGMSSIHSLKGCVVVFRLTATVQWWAHLSVHSVRVFSALLVISSSSFFLWYWSHRCFDRCTTVTYVRSMQPLPHTLTYCTATW